MLNGISRRRLRTLVPFTVSTSVGSEFRILSMFAVNGDEAEGGPGQDQLVLIFCEFRSNFPYQAATIKTMWQHSAPENGSDGDVERKAKPLIVLQPSGSGVLMVWGNAMLFCPDLETEQLPPAAA